MQESLVFITGGIKSGKSSFALKIGEDISGSRAFIATALPIDEDLGNRIKKHQEERGERWITFEEPKNIISKIEAITDRFEIILIDCLTLWLSNLLTLYNMNTDAVQHKFSELLGCLLKCTTKLIIVSNEVGLGIIPADPLSRSYQNLLGKLNSEVALIADSVYFMVSGIPVKIKSSNWK